MEMKALYADKGVEPQQGNSNGNSKPFVPSSQRMMIPGRNRFGTYQQTHGDKAVLVFALFFNCFLMANAPLRPEVYIPVPFAVPIKRLK